MANHSPPAFSALAGLRAYTAFWIYILHFFFGPPYDIGLKDGMQLSIFGAIPLVGFLGVEIFFMLSGFLLYYTHGKVFEGKATSRQMNRFYLQRLARVYPMFLLALAGIAGLHLMGIPHPNSSGTEGRIFEHWQLTLLLNALLFNAWGIFPVASWNEPAWSVSALFYVYILFPLLVMPVRFLKNSWVQVATVLCLVLLYYGIIHVWVEGLSPTDGIGGLMRVVVFFTVGMLLCALYQKDSVRNALPWDHLFVVAVGLFLAALALFLNMGIPFLFVMLPLPLLFFALACSSRYIHRLFADRMTIYLGSLSYSFYLLHYPYLLLVRHYFGDFYRNLAATGSQMEMWVHFLLLLAILIALSALCYHYLEMPCTRWIKGKLRQS